MLKGGEKKFIQSSLKGLSPFSCGRPNRTPIPIYQLFKLDCADPPDQFLLYGILVLLFIVFGADGADITSFHNTLVPSVALSIVEGGKAKAKAKRVGGTCTESLKSLCPHGLHELFTAKK